MSSNKKDSMNNQQKRCINNHGEECIGRWISILYRCGHQYIEKQLKPFNIGKGQFIFLAELYIEDGISQDELSNNLYIDKGTTARALLTLEREGFIERRQDMDDRRINKVFLTAKAHKIRDDFFAALNQGAEFFETGFTDDERRQALSLLKRMANNMTGVAPAAGVDS